MQPFKQLGVPDDLIRGLEELKIHQPTKVQEEAIPFLMTNGGDLIGKHLFRYIKYSKKIFIEVLAGGDNIDRQAAALQRPTHIIVATPGRLLDMMRRKALSLDAIKYLILDEADEMLSMGFKKELSQIFELTSKRRSTWLFSATFPESVDLLTKDCMSGRPHFLKIDRAH
ncbi:MAG: DEAD/DEAH box helicase, partial [Verrucomicrobiales bacterium]